MFTMASRENLPKIVVDIQDIVSQICDDFKGSNDPITDDNHTLHRFCAKLEFLLSSCTKDRSLMGNKKDYWHWMFACLKNNKGLSSGLKYVQANKEVRSTKGKGRAFIRYCLVHQTLADSLQNCIMNRAITRQYFTSVSILINSIYSSAFVTSLYDLNTVNFDLNSKGYDLDSGWPTFASKRNAENPMIDHWAISSHVGSLSSYQTPSVVMDTPRMHGSGSSGPHSVDQRVEELVLELDQSDQKLREQQEIIMNLENKAENTAKSTNEKEDILAAVISDLEAKNRHLHLAMSDMTSEFQAREQQWSEKHDDLTKNLSFIESKNSSLSSKIEQLEEDKRTLEDLVSQKMSTITSSFAQATETAIFTPVTTIALKQSNQVSDEDTMDPRIQEIRDKNNRLSEELVESRERCIELQHRVNELSASESRSADETIERLKEKQSKIDSLQQQLSSLASSHDLVMNNIRDALSLDESAEISSIVTEIIKLREKCAIQMETQVHGHDAGGVSSDAAASLKEENEFLKYDRDVAHMDVDTLKHKLISTKLEVDQLSVELESSRSDSTHRILELEENFSICQDQLEKQQLQHKEMLTDLKLTQDALNVSEKELEAAKQRCQELEQNERSLIEGLQEEINDKESELQHLQSEIRHHASLNQTLDRQLEAEKIKSSRLSVDLLTTKSIADSFSKQLIETSKSVNDTESTLSHLQSEVDRLNDLEASHQRIINFLSNLVERFLEAAKLIDDSDNLESLEIDENDLLNQRNPTEVDFENWENLSTTFLKILLEYKDRKSEVKKLRLELSKLRDSSSSSLDQMESDISVLREQLAEASSRNEIHLITIKDLTDKLTASQDGKAIYSRQIENLQFEVNDLKLSAGASEKEADDLRLRVMSESTLRLNGEDKVKRLEEDVESLKGKITQLLRDKDSLWKEGEVLRNRLHDRTDTLEEIGWMEDNEVSNCTHCNSQFTLTNRKHHCRKCGKIFCKTCCDNWKLTDKLRLRLCDTCFNSPDLDMSNISMDRSAEWMTPKSSSPFSLSKEYGELSVGEAMSPISHLDNNQEGEVKSNVDGENLSENCIVVAARREYHVPVEIERPGVTLYWEITSDRDIDFKLCYSVTEKDKALDLVPKRRINSHVEPFVGNLVARQEGVYTLVLDNSFSRFTAKNVTYKLGIVSNEEILS